MFNSHPTDSAHQPTTVEPTAPGTRADVPEVESLGLLQGQREVLIRHGNDCYRLRHTRNDKLILTK